MERIGKEKEHFNVKGILMVVFLRQVSCLSTALLWWGGPTLAIVFDAIHEFVFVHPGPEFRGYFLFVGKIGAVVQNLIDLFFKVAFITGNRRRRPVLTTPSQRKGFYQPPMGR